MIRSVWYALVGDEVIGENSKVGTEGRGESTVSDDQLKTRVPQHCVDVARH